jgi:hypothetical protein
MSFGALKMLKDCQDKKAGFQRSQHYAKQAPDFRMISHTLSRVKTDWWTGHGRKWHQYGNHHPQAF